MIDRLSLKIKMIGGFTLIALIAGAIGAVGIRGLHHLTGHLVELSQNDYVFSNLANKTLYGILQHRRFEKDVFLHSAEPANRTNFLREFETSVSELRNTLRSLDKLAKGNPRVPEETRNMVESLPLEHEAYIEGFHTVVSRIKDDPLITAQQANALMLPYKQLIYTLEDKIRTIKGIGDKMADSIVTTSIRQSAEQRLFLSVAVAVGFLSAIFLGILVAGWICKPITQISCAADELRKGNCLVEIDHHSADELGCMAEAFRQMVAAQQRKVEMAKKIAAGDLDAPLELASEQDTLGRALQTMASDLKRYIHDLTETTAAKERIQSELKVAKDIQASLLPRIFPPFPDRPEVDIFAIMDPAKEVGGDFYDFFFVDDRRLFFLIADVSDKGIPAALYMMVAKTLLKTEALRGISPGEVISRVNDLLAPDNDRCMFVTVLCAFLDTVTGEVSMANAGHNPPIICSSDRGAEFVRHPPSIVLGVMVGTIYETKTLTLRPNDALLLYTDGVTEAMNGKAVLFSEKRLLQVVAGLAKENMTRTVHSIREEVRSFAGDTPQSDDITMVALRFTGSGPL
ncbi:MAG: SpoIIE family protein phosphatase [Deltaproteobacteria bacterium]|nr:SpoIIE family protein phosphatase [Deltaproteobacteria bacterium]